MRSLALVLSLLVATHARAEDLTYAKVAADPKPYKGKVVHLVFDHTHVQTKVNALLAHRGITDSNHFQVSTLFRKGGTGLILLVKRKKAPVVKFLRETKRNTKIVLTGEVDKLSGDSGAVWYYLDISGARLHQAPKKKTTEPEKNPRPELTGGSKSKYTPVDPKALAKDPEKYHDKKIELVVPWLGYQKRVMPAAVALLGGKAEHYRSIRLGRAAGLVKRSNKKAIAVFDGLKPLVNKVRVRGVLKVKRAGWGLQVAMRVDEALPAR